jgi:hypothetical protein
MGCYLFLSSFVCLFVCLWEGGGLRNQTNQGGQRKDQYEGIVNKLRPNYIIMSSNGERIRNGHKDRSKQSSDLKVKTRGRS